ncbi:Ras family protein [Planctomycetes bacterium Poly30]|uniref:Ras family protein n=1 Tax=Saltatorellus ferox TaxID=2528018 RepID=A0A518EXJ5_9BACT|nr:Ras family protein [Planctomycetes bacterium Poly30]
MGLSVDATPRKRKFVKKVVILGHFGVGKTSLVRRFVHSMFSEDYHTTIGVKIDKKVIETEDHQLSMVLWDVEGGADQERIPRSYFLGTHGVFYVCDLTRPNTFMDIDRNLQVVKERSPAASVVVVGNKVDLLSSTQRASFESGEKLLLDFISSAGTGENVDRAFGVLGSRMLLP